MVHFPKLLGQNLRLIFKAQMLNFCESEGIGGDDAADFCMLALFLTNTRYAEGFFTAREFEFSGTLKKSSEDFFENLIDAAAGKNIRSEEDSRVPVENLLDIFTR